MLLYCVATSTAAAKITDQPGDGSMEKLYLLNPENSKTFLILFQPKMCKNACLFPRAHFVGATCAPTESFLKSPLLPWPSLWQYWQTKILYPIAGQIGQCSAHPLYSTLGFFKWGTGGIGLSGITGCWQLKSARKCDTSSQVSSSLSLTSFLLCSSAPKSGIMMCPG